MSREEFEQVLSEQLPELYKAARGLTGRRDSAEELAHDVCIKAIEAFDGASLQNPAACRGWLQRIMLNAFRDRYRRDRNSPVDAHFDLDNVIEFVPSRRADSATEYERDAFKHRLDASLQALHPDVRFATVLHLIKGFAYKDIAGIMDCPIGTVMSRISKGRRVLREHLADFDVQEPDQNHVPAGDEGTKT